MIYANSPFCVGGSDNYVRTPIVGKGPGALLYAESRRLHNKLGVCPGPCTFDLALAFPVCLVAACCLRTDYFGLVDASRP